MAVEVFALPRLDGRHLSRRGGGGEIGGDPHEQVTRRKRLDDVVVRADPRPLVASSSPARAESMMIGMLRSSGSARSARTSPKPSRRGIMTFAQHERRPEPPDARERGHTPSATVSTAQRSPSRRETYARMSALSSAKRMRDFRFRRLGAGAARQFGQLRGRLAPTRDFLHERPHAERGRRERASGAHAIGRQMRHPAWDAHAERRALPGSTLDLNLAPMQPHELLNQRKPDAGALVAARTRAFDAMKALEETRQLLGCDPGARVDDFETRLRVEQA